MTEEIKKILVPIDNSSNSLQGLKKALYLARKCGASITAFHVLELPVMSVIRITNSMLENGIKKADKIISKSINVSDKEEIGVDYKTTSGRPGPEIVKFAQKNKFDLIVIGARGLGSGKELLLGSVSSYVIHKSKIPVLLIR
jgi:nucleotide-binding universal stress UspA family protein